MLKAIGEITIEITILSLDEDKHSIRTGNHFITDTIKNGIEIYGNIRKILSKNDNWNKPEYSS